MNKQLTDIEKEKIRNLCFANPAKACAFAQEIIDTCQVMSCATYASVKGKAPRTVQYQAGKLTGINIEQRRYIALNQ